MLPRSLSAAFFFASVVFLATVFFPNTVCKAGNDESIAGMGHCLACASFAEASVSAGAFLGSASCSEAALSFFGVVLSLVSNSLCSSAFKFKAVVGASSYVGGRV